MILIALLWACLCALVECSNVGISGVPWMFYDPTSSKIILSGGTLVAGFTDGSYPYGWFDQNQEVYSYDPQTNITTYLAGSTVSSGQQDGTSSNAVFRSLKGATPYFNNGKTIGYLFPDRCSIRFLNSSLPSVSASPLGFNVPPSCSTSTLGTGSSATTGLVSSVATGTKRNSYTYIASDHDFNILYSLSGNNTVMTSSLYYNGTNSLLGVSSTIFVKSLIVNGVSITSNDWDILVIADNSSRVSYLRSGVLKVVAQVGTPNGFISSVKQYGTLFLVTKYNESSTSLYVGHDLANLTRSTSCVSPGNFSVDTILLPNGTVIQTQNVTGNMYVLPCVLQSYTPVDMVPSIHTKSKSISPQHSTTPSITQDKSQSFSFTPTPSLSYDTTSSPSATESYEKMSHTSNDTRSVTKSVSKTESASKTLSKTLTGTSSHSKKHSKTRSSVSLSTNETNPETESRSMENTRSSEVSSSPTLESTLTLGLSRSSTRSPEASVSSREDTKTLQVVLATSAPLGSLITSTSITMNVIASFSGIQGGKTSIFLSIIENQCGSTRELEVYEDPFRTDLVVLGNLGFMLVTIITMLWLAGLKEAFYDKKHLTTRELLAKYKVVDVLFIEWGLFLPGILTSFAKYQNTWYYKLLIVVGVIFIVMSISTVALGARKVFILKVDCSLEAQTFWQRLYEETHIWLNHKTEPTVIPIHWILEAMTPPGELVVPIVEGYTSKLNMWIDVSMSFTLACLTIVDNCKTLAIVTICLNVGYASYIWYFNALQPRTMIYANMIFSLGQSLIIIIVITSSYSSYAGVLFYFVSILGIMAMSMSFLREMSHWFMKHGETNESQSSLQLLDMRATNVVDMDDVIVPKEPRIEGNWDNELLTTVACPLNNRPERLQTTGIKLDDSEL
jgi:hypothetical protein